MKVDEIHDEMFELSPCGPHSRIPNFWDSGSGLLREIPPLFSSLLPFRRTFLPLNHFAFFFGFGLAGLGSASGFHLILARPLYYSGLNFKSSRGPRTKTSGSVRVGLKSGQSGPVHEHVSAMWMGVSAAPAIELYVSCKCQYRKLQFPRNSVGKVKNTLFERFPWTNHVLK